MPLPHALSHASRRSKRSITISLVLLAGTGAAALALAQLDPSQEEEDALVYKDDGECIAQALRSAEECTRAFKAARESYPTTAPRYESNADCERHHGPGSCTAAGLVSPGAADIFIPVMAGYMIGRTAAQLMPTQPLYPHAPQEDPDHPSSGGGGYCTGSGGRVWRSSGGTSSIARVTSSTARTVTSSPRMVARGGFGSTGRALSFASSGHSGGHGGG